VSDQQAGEERREIEKGKPGWRGVNGDGGVSRRYWLFELRRHRRGRDTDACISACSSWRPGIFGRPELTAAAARDLRRLPAVVLLRLARRVATLGERRTARRCQERSDQRHSRNPPSQTCHHVSMRCRADARRKILGNPLEMGPSPTAMPENRKKLGRVAGNSAVRPLEFGAT
jgi:hypothetical protein